MKQLLFILLLSVSTLGLGQNLVPNPRFELNSGCPFQLNDITAFATGWSVYDPTPDYFNICATDPQLGAPSNHAGWQQPASGNAYCGGAVYIHPGIAPTNHRESIGAQLISPLVVGQKYYVSLKVSLGHGSRYAINNIGLLFTTEPYCQVYNPPPSVCSTPSVEIGVKNMAHVYSNSIINDTLNWTTISGSFVSDSVYNYVAWGNFFADSLTTAIDRGTSGFVTYYYVDDICASPDSLTCYNFSVGLEERKPEDNITIYPNPIHNRLTMSLKEKAAGIIYIRNSLGQIVLTRKLKDEHEIQLDLSYLPNSIYFLQLDVGKEIITKKIIKQ